ncbi:unnamed protein product [Dibothriocephalus latus]|uniref:Uncharacterized protein n=1 Tax=Dibothriocephalus latus TaxID=60516 RepID=A0A3P6QA41_DIBLA|nr:unnamed protein product [Dibothriocephalus latus]
MDAFTNPKLRCLREPCVSAAELEIGRLAASRTKDSRSRPQTLLALVSNMLCRNGGRRDQKGKLSALNEGIKVLQKTITALGRNPKTADTPTIFEACLKGIALRKTTQLEMPSVKDNPATFTSIEEAAIRLIVR